ncbi:MAG TPA: 60S ribosomal export protein NMD3 [Thermoplasmata archaeon]|nr:60S ribosomal export protein NMD3 [Thermoplasmata archaeon]
MGDDGEFCVVCGATERPLVDGVCAECAADRASLVTAPKRAQVVLCPHCGARLVKDHWERAHSSPVLTAEDLAPFLVVHPEVGIRRVRWDEVAATGTVRELLGHADVGFRGARRDVAIPLSVRTEHRSCPECSRKSGRYYTAILQLRGPADDRPERATDRRARLDAAWNEVAREIRPEWRHAVSWREERPEGWDVYFTDTVAARSVARLVQQRFGGAFKQSASLFGRKDGRDVYRVTYLVRLPRPGGAPAPRTGPRPPAHPLEP